MSKRISRPLLATMVAALALSLPAVGQANKGGVPNSHAAPTTTPLSPKNDRPCKNTKSKDRDRANPTHKGKGKHRGQNRGRKCGQH